MGRRKQIEQETPAFDNRPMDLLTPAEVAEMLRLTPRGIYSMVEQRRIPFIRVSNRIRFDRLDVLRWLGENRVPASMEDR